MMRVTRSDSSCHIRVTGRFVGAVNGVLVLGIIASFTALVSVASGGLEWDALLKANFAAVPMSIPIFALSFVYQNVVPVLCTNLEGDMSKDIFRISDQMIDPLQQLQSSNGVVGPIVEVFSLLAIATSYIGFILGLSDFLADLLKLPAGEKKPQPYLLTLVPPLGLALLDPEIFFKALDFAGTYGGNSLNQFCTCNSAMDGYAKCGSFGYACKVLDKMPERDVVSCTALFSGLVNEGYGNDELSFYCFMKKDGVRPNGHCLVTTLKACSLNSELIFEMELAERVFVYTNKKNVVSWNALLNGYALKGDAGKILDFFRGITESELRCSKFTLSNVLKSCSYSENVTWGLIAHSLVIKTGCEHDEFVGCCLLDMYSKCGLARDALKVFKRVQRPNTVAWSAMINCLDEHGQIQEAAELFCLMRHKGVSPNQHTFASIASVDANSGDQFYCEAIHACILKHGFESEIILSSALIAMYMKIRSVQNGWHVFKEMSYWDLASWNALLCGSHSDKTCYQGPGIFHKMLAEVHVHIIKNGLNENYSVETSLIDFDHSEMAIEYLNQMLGQGAKPNEFTLAACLSSCSKMAMLENEQLLHSLAIKTGSFDDVFVCSAIVDMYANCGCIEEAEAAFQGMVLTDVVSWNKIHTGLVKEGKEHFDSLTNIYGMTPTIKHHACMINVLAQAGKFNKVESFINKEIISNPLIWGTVLGACARHGNDKLGESAAEKLLGLDPGTASHYILLANLFAAKCQWEDVRRVRALMTRSGVKKEGECSWVMVNGRVHVFRSGDGFHPRHEEICVKGACSVQSHDYYLYMPHILDSLE
ncbi:F11F12.5 protein [Hibiscus syriacus]|uniref:F11F12.5 protein n=1 Tax=Hibiscus syriacus TaxID=106335 RepID=A0A6A3AMA1_HIBSY|nr:F11F12.5 protein [Hibiscus syriacus]